MRIVIFSIGIQFFFSITMASNMAVNLTNNDLKIKGELSFNENMPVIISGFDNSKKPYKLMVQAKTQSKGIVQISYSLNRDGKIESGSILQEKGKTAQIYSGPESHQAHGVTFKATITD